MTKERKPQTADKFIVRMPDGMRDKLAEAAKANNRTMNAEVVSRLERSLSDAPVISGMSMRELFQKLEELEQLIKSGEFVSFSQRTQKTSTTKRGP